MKDAQWCFSILGWGIPKGQAQLCQGNILPPSSGVS